MLFFLKSDARRVWAHPGHPLQQLGLHRLPLLRAAFQAQPGPAGGFPASLAPRPAWAGRGGAGRGQLQARRLAGSQESCCYGTGKALSISTPSTAAHVLPAGRLPTECSHSLTDDLPNRAACHGLLDGTEQLRPSFGEADIPVKRDTEQRRKTHRVSADSRTRKTRNRRMESEGRWEWVRFHTGGLERPL